MKTRMISLDTSSATTGWAYWENARLVGHGVIDLSLLRAGEDRLEQMCRELISLMDDKEPDIVVVEMTVVTRNTATQRILSELVGGVRGWCLSQRRQRFFYRMRPTEWRRLVKEEGEKMPRSKKDGLKEWDIVKAEELFEFIPADDNEADAVLIGWAYIRLCGDTEIRGKNQK